MNKLVIIDGNAIVHRAYHALPPMTTKNGLMVNAVYGFTSMLLKVIKDLKPTHLAVTFDMAGPTFRHVKYEKYKATRVRADQELYDQIPLAHEVVAALGVPVYEKQGYEADDVIGTVVKKMEKKDSVEVFIVTGDMDTLQLIRPGVKVYTLRKGMSDIVIYDAAAVKERFGFGPELTVDYKALRGDTSDNIPGVPGIGEKTATDLIKAFGHLDNLYKAVKVESKKSKSEKFSPSVLKKLVEGEASALMSHELATIDAAVPDLNFKLDDCELKEFDREKIDALFQKFEFVSLLKRLPGGKDDPRDMPGDKSGKKPAKNLKFDFTEINSAAELEKAVKLIESKKQFAARPLVNGRDVFSAEFLGLALVAGGKSFWVSASVILKKAKGTDSSATLQNDIVKIFADKDLELIGHDLKQLIKILTVHNIEVKNKLFDTMIASYLLAPGSRAHDAGSVVLKILGKELPAGAGQESLFGVDKKAGAQELFLVAQCADKLKDELKKTDNLGLLEKVEMPLIPILAQMELNGIAVDKEMLKRLSVEVAAAAKKVTKKIYGLAGTEFNISSPIQLREILFEKMGLPTEGVKKGKTGLSTGAEELERLRGLHPIIDDIEEYRELTKLQNTYIDVLPVLINKSTGRIHTTFNQAVTATGRLSSSDPNLQNIPIRTELGREIRKAFVSEAGNFLVSADYSQIELRIVASLAQDERMMEIFERGEDIHTAAAAAINGVPLDKVTKEMRRAAKEVNFGILYGMGAYGLSWRAEISRAEAKDFIEKYFREFAGVRKYIDRTLEFTRKEGYCETLFGRRRYIPELRSGNFQLRAAAERMAINHPIQGTAADLIKMAMVEIDKKLYEVFCHPEPRHGRGEGSKNETDSSPASRRVQNDGVRMILQVHDELVFEVKKDLAEKVGAAVKEAMESVVKLRVPIHVDINIGHSWGEMK